MSEIKSKQNKVTIFDVAKEAGVSYSTVSRVVNDFHYVKPETRERVQAVMDRLGYVANLKARSLAGGRSQMLGLLLYDFETSYQVEIVRGIDAEVSALDYDLTLYTTHHRRRKESTLVAKLIQGLVDGLLIVLPRNLEAYLEDLDNQSFPYVLIDHAGSVNSSNSVKAKNFQGCFDAVSHLAELGHKHIGFVTGTMETDSAKERLEGYKKAVCEYGLVDDDALIQYGDFTKNSGYSAAMALLELNVPLTAVIASSDACAFGVIEAIHEKGLRVPDDISVVGFDDIPQAATSSPKLTTMRQDLRKMGSMATRLLLKCIDDPNHPIEHIEMPMELILRETTAPPPPSSPSV